MKNAAATLLLAAAALVACAEDPTYPVRQLDEETDQILLRAEVGLPAVVASISRALALPDVRYDVLAAMRASTRVEHGLLLTRYLRSAAGAGLLEEGARALGVSETEFVARIEMLGEMEVSVPVREQRISWTGTPAVAVGGSMDPDLRQIAVHEPSGHRRTVAFNAVERYDAFFYVRPRETLGTRIGRQADVAGPVIQDPDDGEHAIITTWRAEGRTPVSVDHGQFDSEEELRRHLDARFGTLLPFAYLCAESTLDDCGPGGEPVVTHSPTDLEGFGLSFDSEPGTEEVEITVGYSHGSGTLRYEGVDAFAYVNCGDQILSVSPATGGTGFYVSAVETDWAFDDDLGYATFGHSPGGASLNLSRIAINLSW